jgi:hypothetical protein
MNYTIKSFEEAVLAIQKKVKEMSNQALYENSFVVDYYSDCESHGLYEDIEDKLMTYEYEKRLTDIGFLTEVMKPFNLEYRVSMKFHTPIYNELHEINLEGQDISCVYDGKEFGYYGVWNQDFDINTIFISGLNFFVKSDGTKVKLS